MNKQTILDPFFDASLGSGQFAPRIRTKYPSKRLQAVIKQFREAEARVRGEAIPTGFGNMLADLEEGQEGQEVLKSVSETAAVAATANGEPGSDGNPSKGTTVSRGKTSMKNAKSTESPVAGTKRKRATTTKTTTGRRAKASRTDSGKDSNSATTTSTSEGRAPSESLRTESMPYTTPPVASNEAESAPADVASKHGRRPRPRRRQVRDAAEVSSVPHDETTQAPTEHTK